MLPRALLLLVALLLGGCVSVRSSAVPTSTAPRKVRPAAAAQSTVIQVRALEVPAGAQELGLVEANGVGVLTTLDQVIAEFRRRVAALGGDFGKIDSVTMNFEMQSQSYSYGCGNKNSSTCTGWRQVEVPTLSVIGRAFQTEVTSP